MAGLKPVTALIFSAFPDELKYYHENIADKEEVLFNNTKFIVGMYKGKKIAYTDTGLGKVASAITMSIGFSNFDPSIALFTGTSGSFDGKLKTSKCVIGQYCTDADLLGIHKELRGTGFESALAAKHYSGEILETYEADHRLISAAMAIPAEWKIVGHLATSDIFPCPIDKIEALRLKGVDTIDMESSAFYQVASSANIPHLAIRSVSNELDEEGKDGAIASADVSTSNMAALTALEIVKQWEAAA